MDKVFSAYITHSASCRTPLGSYLSLHKDWIEILHVSQSHFDAVKPLMGKNLQRPILNEISTHVDVEKWCLWVIADRLEIALAID